MDYKYKAMDERVRQRQPPLPPPPPPTMSNAQHQSLTYFTQQALRAGYSVPPPPASHTDEELGIPQQRFQNCREIREAIMIEIEKEKRSSLEIKSEINRMEKELLLLPSRSNCELIGASISLPVPRLFAPPLSDYGLIRDPIVPLPRDDGMSVEEKLARSCEEKRLVEKAAAAAAAAPRRWQYGG